LLKLASIQVGARGLLLEYLPAGHAPIASFGPGDRNAIEGPGDQGGPDTSMSGGRPGLRRTTSGSPNRLGADEHEGKEGPVNSEPRHEAEQGTKTVPVSLRWRFDEM